MLCRPLIAHARLDHLCTLLPPSPYYPTATSSSHTLRAFALFSLAINLPSSFRPIRPFLSPASQLLPPPPPPLFSSFPLSLLFSPLFSSSHPYFRPRRSRSPLGRLLVSVPIALACSGHAAVPAHAAVLHAAPTRYLRLSKPDPPRQLRRPRSVVSLDRGHFFSLRLLSLSMVSAPPRFSATENLETRSFVRPRRGSLRRWPSVVRRNPVLIKARLDARRRPGRGEREASSLLLSPLFPFALTAVRRVSICPNLSPRPRPTHSIGVSVPLRRLLPPFPRSARLDPPAPPRASPRRPPCARRAAPRPRAHQGEN